MFIKDTLLAFTRFLLKFNKIANRSHEADDDFKDLAARRNKLLCSLVVQH